MAIDLSAKKSNFISRAVQAAVALKAARDTLLTLQSEWTAMGYSTTIVDADFTGANAHMSAAILASLMTSQANLENFWVAQFNGTNVDKLIP